MHPDPRLSVSQRKDGCYQPVVHRSEISYMFLLRSLEGLEQLLEGLWRNFLLDASVKQMGVLLLPAWQETLTIIRMRASKATAVFQGRLFSLAVPLWTFPTGVGQESGITRPTMTVNGRESCLFQPLPCLCIEPIPADPPVTLMFAHGLHNSHLRALPVMDCTPLEGLENS